MKHGSPLDFQLPVFVLRSAVLTVYLFSAVLCSGVDLGEIKRTIAAGMPHAVIPMLKQAVTSEGDPDAAERARLLLAEAYLVGGQPGLALEQLDLLKSEVAEQLEQACVLRAEAFLELGRYEEALSAINHLPGLVFLNHSQHASIPRSPSAAIVSDRAKVVCSRILFALGRFEESLNVLDGVSKDSSLAADVVLDRVALLLELNRLDEAEGALRQISHGDLEQQNRADFLQAKWMKAKGNREEAAVRFQSLASRPSVYSERALVQAGECLMELGLLDEAANLIEQYLRDSQGRQWRLPVFVLLDRLYGMIYETRGSVSSSELRRLAFDMTEPERAMTAWFYLGRNEARLGKRDSAIVVLQRFMFDYPNHPLWAQAHLETAGWLMERGDYAEALRVLARVPEQRLALFLSGVASFRQKDYAEAQRYFVGAAAEVEVGGMRSEAKGQKSEGEERKSIDAERRLSTLGLPPLKESAIFNAKLARLLGGDAGIEIGELSDDALAKKLQLIKAFVAAHRRDPQAPEKLSNLVPVANGEAQLALAEWAFTQLDYAQAHQLLDSMPKRDLSEQAAYLEVFLAEGGGANAAENIRSLGEEYLKKFPSGQHVPDVRMKLAETLIASGDYLGGRAQLESIIALVPGTELAARARFLSAQAAMKLMTPQFLDAAMLEFEEIARGDHGLAVRARFEQALIQNALGQPAQALVLLDQVIAKAQDADVRYSAMIEKGDTLFSMGKTDSKYFEEAVRAWRTLADDSQASARWRNEALCKIGLALEQMKRPEESLEAFYKVVLSPENATGDFVWFYRSGFEAGRILEKTGAPREAIRVYDQLAKIDGPRAEEARSRANRLRLENFIWNE